MKIDINLVKELREKTSAGLMDCRNALLHSRGDIQKAILFLREKGISVAAKRADKNTNEGQIGSYIHAGGKIGVLIEVNCETDFVARTKEFQDFIKDMSMQIAASKPQYIKREDIPEEVIEKEREICNLQLKDSGKSPQILEKIVEGKMDKFYSEVCLLEQPFIKDTDRAVKDILNDIIAKVGENIMIKRFVRYQIGETN